MDKYIELRDKLSFKCKSCLKEFKVKSFYFATESEILKDLEHQCKQI